MTTGNVKPGNQPHKVMRDLVLFQNDRCVVRISEGTLTLSVLVDDTVQGWLFHGKGQLMLDTIVETPRGAVGKSLVEDLTLPFLMFGEATDLSQNSTAATVQDVARIGYNSLEEFLSKATEVLGRFTKRGHGPVEFDEGSYIFAFTVGGDPSRWDMLISKGNRLVYKSKNRVYVSRGKAGNVSVHPREVLVARHGKTVVIGKDSILIDSSNDEP